MDQSTNTTKNAPPLNLPSEDTDLATQVIQAEQTHRFEETTYTSQPAVTPVAVTPVVATPSASLTPASNTSTPINPFQNSKKDEDEVKEEPEAKGPGFFLKFVVLVLLLLLLIVGILLPLKIIPSISSGFSSGIGPTLSALFGGSKKSTSVATTASSTSATSTASGATTFGAGVTYTAGTSTGTANSVGTANTGGVTATSTTGYTWTTYTWRPYWESSSTQSSTYSSVANTSTTNSGSSGTNSASGNSSGTTYSSGSNSTNNTAGSSSTYASAPTNTYTGLPNLVVTILNTGYETGPGAEFIPASSVPYGDLGAVQFEISNNGGSPTGPWSFIASLPSLSNPTFTSNIEPSMTPGSRIVFTLAFGDLNPNGPDTATITADPGDAVRETTKTDNTASVTLLAGQDPYSYTSGTTYNPNTTYTSGTNGYNTDFVYPTF